MERKVKRNRRSKNNHIECYHRFRWYATLENKTPAETFPKLSSVLRVIDCSDRNPPITATSVTFWPSLRHASGRWLVDFDPICRLHVRLSKILETFPRVFCFPKSRINENGSKRIRNATLINLLWLTHYGKKVQSRKFRFRQFSYCFAFRVEVLPCMKGPFLYELNRYVRLQKVFLSAAFVVNRVRVLGSLLTPPLTFSEGAPRYCWFLNICPPFRFCVFICLIISSLLSWKPSLAFYLQTRALKGKGPGVKHISCILKYFLRSCNTYFLL